MPHEDPEFVEAVAKVSRPGHIAALYRKEGRAGMKNIVPHGVPTIRTQTACRFTYDLLDFDAMRYYLNQSPLGDYLHTWHGKVFLHGAGIFWTLLHHQADSSFDVYVKDEYYDSFIEDLMSNASSGWYGVGAKYASICLEGRCQVNVKSLDGRMIEWAIAEEPVGIAAMFLDGDALFASDLGALALSYGVNVITNNQKLDPDTELQLIRHFERGVQIVLPHLDAQKLVDADGRLATVQFIGLDTSRGCACGLSAASIAYRREGQTIWPRNTSMLSQGDIAYYNVWAHAVGCRLYARGRAGHLPTLDLNKMVYWATSWPHDKPLYTSAQQEDMVEAAHRKHAQILDDHRMNRMTVRNWSAC